MVPALTSLMYTLLILSPSLSEDAGTTTPELPRAACLAVAVSSAAPGEHVSAGADTPGHQQLREDALLDCLAHEVLLAAAHLAQQHQHPNVGVCLVAEQVDTGYVPTGRPRWPGAGPRTNRG